MINFRHFVLSGFIAMMSLTALAEDALIAPGAEIDYGKLAFYPQRWAKSGVSTRMYPWEGTGIVLLTTKNDLDKIAMTNFVKRLDAGWQLYANLTGRKPRLYKQINGRSTIAAIPKGSLTCGYGCGYVGATGIEASAFYRVDYPLAIKDPDAFSHYLFYEMGRNYYTFGDRHSLFVTGYAVFMRYVCMDTLKCKDPDAPTRRTIENCEAVYAASKIPFMTAFTNLSTGEKGNRLKDRNGKTISPSDQPVMYATAMLKLHRECGGNPWLKRFYRHLAQCPRVKPNNPSRALKQACNWLVSASAAAQKDLTPIFVDRWRMPLDKIKRQMLGKVDWKSGRIDVASIIKKLTAEP